MDNSEDKKQGLDKIVLMGLFVVSLIIAHFIVVSRTAVLMSEPIELPYLGLLVSLPSGNGWQNQDSWEYQSNTYVVSSDFNVGSSEPIARVSCRYMLAAEEISPAEWLQQQADVVEGTIGVINQLQTDTLTIDWAVITNPALVLCSYIATVELPGNRRLTIDARQVGGMDIVIEQAFSGVLENLKFQGNMLIDDGTEIVSDIKSKGLSSLFDSTNQQSCYIINDARGRNIGFTIDNFNISAEQDRFNIQASTVLRQNNVEQRTVFRSNDSCNEFVWQSELYGNRSRSSTELVLNETGILDIRGLALRGLSGNSRPGPAAIPDIFFEKCLLEMLDRNKEQLMFDLIDSDGRIRPVVVNVIEPEDESEFAYTVLLHFLDENNSTETIYFDSSKRIVKAVLKQSQTYIFETISIEELIQKFPDYNGSGRIPQNNVPRIQPPQGIIL